jgi:hypothetical protein
MLLGHFRCLRNIVGPALPYIEDMPIPSPGRSRGVVRLDFTRPVDEASRFLVVSAVHAVHQGHRAQKKAARSIALPASRLIFEEQHDRIYVGNDVRRDDSAPIRNLSACKHVPLVPHRSGTIAEIEQPDADLHAGSAARYGTLDDIVQILTMGSLFTHEGSRGSIY